MAISAVMLRRYRPIKPYGTLEQIAAACRGDQGAMVEIERLRRADGAKVCSQPLSERFPYAQR